MYVDEHLSTFVALPWGIITNGFEVDPGLSELLNAVCSEQFREEVLEFSK